MIDFSATTTFGVVRRVAAVGLTARSLYILICKLGEMEAVQSDLKAEMDVQLGSELRFVDASSQTSEGLLEAIVKNGEPRAILLAMRRWEPKLVDSLDRNIVLVTNAGPVLLLADFKVAERILSAAPNLRNRLADVLLIRPDQFVRQASV